MAKQLNSEPQSAQRRKCTMSYKSNTRVYDDLTIVVTPRATGEPSQREVKKLGRSKRYVTTGKSPLMCVELKCPESVVDKATFFQRELAKLTRDIAIRSPQLPDAEYLIDDENLKLCFEPQEGRIHVWMTFDTKGVFDIRKELYNLTSNIDKCFVINNDLICPQGR